MSVRSDQPDTVIQKIFEHLKNDAKRQLTAAHSGVLCVELSDITGEQLKELGRLEHSGLRTMLDQLFERRTHLDMVVFVAHDRHRKAHSSDADGVEYARVSYVYFRKGVAEDVERTLARMFRRV